MIKILVTAIFINLFLGFAGFVHIDELLDVKLKDIKIQESHLEIVIPKSKTDQHREGHSVYISRIK